MKVSELVDTLNSFIPFKQAFEDDKVGLLIGSDSQDVSGILIAHDLEDSVLNYCLENNINVAITYHPPPIQETLISDDKYVDELIGISLDFEKHNINVISLHTAQDVVSGGNAETLVELLNIRDSKIFAKTDDNLGAGRIGIIDKISGKEFIDLVENKLNTKVVRTNAYFSQIKEIEKIAVLPGSGTQFIDEIIDEADVFLTGDISHRYFLMSDDKKLGLVQVNHISTEIPGMRKMANKLNNELNMDVQYFYNENYE